MRHAAFDALLMLLLLASPAFALGVGDALNALAPGSQWSCQGTTYDSCQWLDPGVPKPTQQQVMDWLAAHANDAANEQTRINSFSGNAANCSASTLAPTADCVAFIEQQLKTLNQQQFVTWWANNVTTTAKANLVLELTVMALAHQLRIP